MHHPVAAPPCTSRLSFSNLPRGSTRRPFPTEVRDRRSRHSSQATSMRPLPPFRQPVRTSRAADYAHSRSQRTNDRTCSGCTYRCRVRLSRFRGICVVWSVSSCQDTRRDYQSPQQGSQYSADSRGRAGGVRRRGHRACSGHARSARALHPERNGKMGQAHQTGRHQG